MKRLSFQSSAPGRLDVMGGIADYSGSLVLQMPISDRTTVDVELRDDFMCDIRSTTRSQEHLAAKVDYREFLNEGKPDYGFAREKLRSDPAQSWIAYIVGCILVLDRERKISFTGANFNIRSTVPLGKGVSSSASLEVAVMKAIGDAFAIDFTGTELARLAQRAENDVAGAPCGLMDQLATAYGVPGKLLPIICQPDTLDDPIDIPDEVFFYGIDSGERHRVSGSPYESVRCATFMGFSMILQALGISPEEIAHSKKTGEKNKLPFGGYLCNIPLTQFEKEFSSWLPEKLTGKDFIKRWQTTSDPLTTVHPEKVYDVLQCCSHPVYENIRARQFANLIVRYTPTPEVHRTFRELMWQSHQSYSRCGLGSRRTDAIVSAVNSGQYPGLVGAKITGGGSGGTVCVMATGSEGKQSISTLHQSLCNQYNEPLALFN